jgi:mannose-6-phosphate isomerase-like protein (cupin superfamily)
MPTAIDKHFVVLDNTQRATLEPADATLYQRLDENYHGFQGHTLVSSYEFSADWSNWELHPAGDEVVILLSGQATMLLQHEHGVEQIELLKANDCCVVPSNTWHTAKIADTAKMLFVTPGAGTVQRKA